MSPDSFQNVALRKFKVPCVDHIKKQFFFESAIVKHSILQPEAGSLRTWLVIGAQHKRTLEDGPLSETGTGQLRATRLSGQTESTLGCLLVLHPPQSLIIPWEQPALCPTPCLCCAQNLNTLSPFSTTESQPKSPSSPLLAAFQEKPPRSLRLCRVAFTEGSCSGSRSVASDLLNAPPSSPSACLTFWLRLADLCISLYTVQPSGRQAPSKHKEASNSGKELLKNNEMHQGVYSSELCSKKEHRALQTGKASWAWPLHPWLCFPLYSVPKVDRESVLRNTWWCLKSQSCQY